MGLTGLTVFYLNLAEMLFFSPIFSLLSPLFLLLESNPIFSTLFIFAGKFSANCKQPTDYELDLNMHLHDVLA